MITQEKFSDQRDDIYLFTLCNASGMMMKVTNYGGIITELHVPDRYGNFSDVVLGFKSYEEYLKPHPFFGALVGRVAGRLTGASYEHCGEKFNLLANDGDNHLHGGLEGFDKKVWSASPHKRDGCDQLDLYLLSPDGDQDYPGNVDVKVSYSLHEDNSLKISYKAKTDKSTPLSMTQHAYFNLNGESSASILNHHFQIEADHFTSGDETMTLSGKLEDVRGTAMDLRESKKLSEVIEGFHKEHGDLYWTDPQTHNLKEVAEVYEPETGRQLKVSSTLPCLQFYTGRYISDQWKGKSGKHYHDLSGFCLECQKYPDPDGVDGLGANWLHPHQEYSETTIYQFSVR